MRQHKLRLEDLTVKSFDTSVASGTGGTVKAHVQEEAGTIFSWCRSCDGTCDEHTCQANVTCAPEFTCVKDQTCAEQYSCNVQCDVIG